MRPLDAPHGLIDLVLDTAPSSRGTRPSTSPATSEGYQAELRAAAARKPAPTSRCSPVAGWSAAARWPSWSTSSRFLGGSIGRAAARADHGVRAPGDRRGAARCWRPPPPAGPGCRRARRRSCRWSAISRAVMAHRAAGLPYLVYLRHPTTGGVYASWGSLGHVTVAEPGALDRLPRAEGVRGARRGSRSRPACSRPSTSPSGA